MNDDIDDWTHDIHQGDVREVLAALPADSVHMAMCSPPYFGQRDYGDDTITTWGGDDDCAHDWAEDQVYQASPVRRGGPSEGHETTDPEDRWRTTGECSECGARREQLGLEGSLGDFIRDLVAVGDELKRVLRDDGSWWLNLGDSYAGGGGMAGVPDDWDSISATNQDAHPDDAHLRNTAFTRKTKMLVPHRVAIALVDAGWILRQDCVWAKPSGMPQSVTDRLTETKEFVFHLTPAPDYWFDLDAVREPKANSTVDADADEPLPEGKNPGDMLEVQPKPFADAHFAVYPPELVETPVKASCPPRVCADCGAPYERVTETVPMWERDPETIDRPQTKRALALAGEAGLTDEHFEAARAVGLGNADGSEGKPYDRVDAETERLAREVEEVLGSYFREVGLSEPNPTNEWEPTCDCETDDTKPGIVLDPFAGAGTTCLMAKRLDRRFIGIDLSKEYVALAQRRVGVTVDNPDLLLDDDERPLTAFTGGADE